jgi:hypothetical protein
MPARTVVLTAVIASCASSLVTLAATLLVVAPGIRAAPDPQATQPLVRAERFELMDAQGNTTAVLGKVPASLSVVPVSGTGLVFLDPSGRARAFMGVSENSVPAVAITDPRGRVGALSAYNSPDGSPLEGVGLGLVSPPREGMMIDQAAVLLSLQPDQSSFLQFLDVNGQDRVLIGVQRDGTPLIVRQGARGESAEPDR